jgi:hypothetical protein
MPPPPPLPDLMHVCSEWIAQTLAADLALIALVDVRIWEGEPPQELPDSATVRQFYPCVIFHYITQTEDLYDIGTIDSHVFGTMLYEVKAVTQDEGFDGAAIINKMCFDALQTQGSGPTITSVTGGTVLECRVRPGGFRRIQRDPGGARFFHSGYHYEILAQRA